MRQVAISLDVFNAPQNEKLARERELQAMYRRRDAPPLPDVADDDSARSFAWIVRLARRRPAARARRAVG